MKKMQVSILFYAFVTLCISLTSCQQVKNNDVPYFGEAIFAGKLIGNIPDNEKVSSFEVLVNSVLTAESERVVVKIKDDGTFIQTIPVVGETYLVLMTPFYQGIIPLIANEETRLNIVYDDNGKQTTELESKSGLTLYDAQNMGRIMAEILMSGRFEGLMNLSDTPQEYSTKVIQQLDVIAKQIEDRTDISLKAKTLIINEIKLFVLEASLMNIKERKERLYRTEYNDKIDLDSLNIAKLDIEDFSFLKYFELNKPDYLSTTYQIYLLPVILNCPTFDIQPIGDTEIDVWIADVKKKIGEQVGTESDLIYEVLASVAYASQLNKIQEGQKALTEKQVKNIETYFSSHNHAIAQVLLAENAKTVARLNEETMGYNIVETPNTSNEDVLDTIVSKYKGQVVIVDFWATWCAPCLEAIKKIREIKKEYNADDVAFVYITYTASPANAWKKSLQNIGGEHYYLDATTWEYLYDENEIEGIPFYMIFDKNGKLIHKQTGYMGNEQLKEMIDSLL